MSLVCTVTYCNCMFNSPSISSWLDVLFTFLACSVRYGDRFFDTAQVLIALDANTF